MILLPVMPPNPVTSRFTDTATLAARKVLTSCGLGPQQLRMVHMRLPVRAWCMPGCQARCKQGISLTPGADKRRQGTLCCSSGRSP